MGGHPSPQLALTDNQNSIALAHSVIIIPKFNFFKSFPMLISFLVIIDRQSPLQDVSGTRLTIN